MKWDININKHLSTCNIINQFSYENKEKYAKILTSRSTVGAILKSNTAVISAGTRLFAIPP